MADESYSFSTARTRLEEIVSQVRKKDTSLEKSLDLLEEGVRLANACTELIDHQDWVGTATAEEVLGDATLATSDADAASAESDGEDAPEAADITAEAATASISPAEETIVVEGVAVIDDVVVEDADGNFVAEVIEVTEYRSTEEFADADDAWADDSPAENPEEPDDPSADER